MKNPNTQYTVPSLYFSPFTFGRSQKCVLFSELLRWTTCTLYIIQFKHDKLHCCLNDSQVLFWNNDKCTCLNSIVSGKMWAYKSQICLYPGSQSNEANWDSQTIILIWFSFRIFFDVSKCWKLESVAFFWFLSLLQLIISISVYNCMVGVKHIYIIFICVWIFAQNICKLNCGWLATLNCPMCECVCAHGVLWWTGIPSRMFSHLVPNVPRMRS